MENNVKKETAKMRARMLPHSIEAEQAVLASLLIDKNAPATIFGILNRSDFYDEAHAIIFEAMKELAAKNKPIDYVTLSGTLQAKDCLDKVGDVDYISSLTTILPSSANFLAYTNQVKEKSILRELISTGQSISEIGFTIEDSESAIASAETSFFKLSTLQDISSLKNMSETLGNVIAKFETIHSNPESLVGLRTGFVRLDTLTNGLQKGDLIILAARPSVGKTAFGLNIAANAALGGKKIAIFSLEMPRDQLAQRVLCSVAGVSMSKALSGQEGNKLGQKEWAALTAAKKKLADTSNIFVDDSSMISADKILSKCRRLQREHGLDLVMIDYLQLMTVEKRSAQANRQNEVAEISRMLKIMAKELNVPVIALSQLSRLSAKEDRKPVLSDLRESGAIEQDADIVMFLHRNNEAGADGSVMQLIVAKHRNGALDDNIGLKWIGDIVSFKNLDFDANLASMAASAPAAKKRAIKNADGEEMFVPTDDEAPPESAHDTAASILQGL